MAREHYLKTVSPYFDDVASRVKLFDVRRDDRGFEVGDHLFLMHIDDSGERTGHVVHAEVTYVLRGPKFGIEDGHCVMSLKILETV